MYRAARSAVLVALALLCVVAASLVGVSVGGFVGMVAWYALAAPGVAFAVAARR